MKSLFLMTCAVSALMFVQSCTVEDDPKCPTMDCVNGTQNADCGCDCKTGFEKDSAGLCTKAWADNFVGTGLNVKDTVYGDNGNFGIDYVVDISKNNEAKLSISNFGGFSTLVEAEVVESSKLKIDYTDVATRKFTGTGSLESNKITLNYVVTYQDKTADTCMAIITK